MGAVGFIHDQGDAAAVRRPGDGRCVADDALVSRRCDQDRTDIRVLIQPSYDLLRINASADSGNVFRKGSRRLRLKIHHIQPV